MDKNELMREKLMDDALDAERGDRWEDFKSGLDLYDEFHDYLHTLDKTDLIEMLLEGYYNYNSDDAFEDYLRDIYCDEW